MICHLANFYINSIAFFIFINLFLAFAFIFIVEGISKHIKYLDFPLIYGSIFSKMGSF